MTYSYLFKQKTTMDPHYLLSISFLPPTCISIVSFPITIYVHIQIDIPPKSILLKLIPNYLCLFQIWWVLTDFEEVIAWLEIVISYMPLVPDSLEEYGIFDSGRQNAFLQKPAYSIVHKLTSAPIFFLISSLVFTALLSILHWWPIAGKKHWSLKYCGFDIR